MSRKPKLQKRRGVAAVELAVVLPLFLMLVFGIVEFGRAFMVGQLLTTGAREGARLAVMGGSTNAEVTQVVKEFVGSTVGIDPGEVNVAISVTPAAGNPNPANNVALANTKDLCAITVTVNFDAVCFVIADYMAGKTLTGHCAMRHE